MKIVVCCKTVPDTQDIRVADDGKLNLSNAQLQVGEYDLRAIEAGMQLAESMEGSEVIALTATDAAMDTPQQRKAMLSRGPVSLEVIQGEGLSNAGSVRTASVLAGAIRKTGDVDIVLFGEGSGDRYAQQVGNLTGAQLGWTFANAVTSVRVDGSTAHITRMADDAVERYAIPLPCALSMTSDANMPRIPKMRDILAAGKKPAEVVPASESGDIPEPEDVESLLAPDQVERANVVFEVADDDAVNSLAEQIKKFL